MSQERRKMSVTATAEPISTVMKARVTEDALANYAEQHPLNAQEVIEDLVDARENFKPENYQDVWAMEGDLRALTHQNRTEQSGYNTTCGGCVVYRRGVR